MKFAFFISTFGGSPLVSGLERGLRSLGHSVDYFYNGMARIFDVLVIFNQCSHTPSYAFPDFPNYDTPVTFIDSAEYGYFRRLPKIVHNYANAFSSGSVFHDTKSSYEQHRLKDYLSGRSFPYFLREYSIYVNYPDSYYPIDYPLYHHSVCHERPHRESYLRRSLDLFVSWGASHPWRWCITNALRAYPFRSRPLAAEINVIEENRSPRFPHHYYFGKMQDARATVSFDGYGSSSFRMTEALVRCLLLQGPLSIRMRAPLVDGETCLLYDLPSRGEECRGTNICERLRGALLDLDLSYRIYEAGYEHCMTHLTETATAVYFVNVLESHWTGGRGVTKLDI